MTDKKAGLNDFVAYPERPFLFSVPVPSDIRAIAEAIIGDTEMKLKVYVVVTKEQKTHLFFNPSDIIDKNMCRVFFVKSEAESWKKTMAVINNKKSLSILHASFNELYPFLRDALLFSNNENEKIVLSMEYKKDIIDIETWTKSTFVQLN